MKPRKKINQTADACKINTIKTIEENNSDKLKIIQHYIDKAVNFGDFKTEYIKIKFYNKKHFYMIEKILKLRGFWVDYDNYIFNKNDDFLDIEIKFMVCWY